MVSYVPHSRRNGAERRHFFRVGNSMSIARKADAEAGGDDSAIVVKGDLKDVRSEDEGYVQAV